MYPLNEIESHENAKSLFDETVEDYTERSFGKVYNFSSLLFQRRISIVESFIERICSPGCILDFGMGPAVFAKKSIESGLKYVGVDISQEMIRKAESLSLPNTKFYVGDLDTLARFDGKMDAVMAIGLIDYLEYPMDGLALLAKCVKPGGMIILSFRNRYSLPRLLRDSTKNLIHMFRPHGSTVSHRAYFSNVHERAFSISRQLRPGLELLGFHDFEVKYFNCSPIFFNFPVPKSVWRIWYYIDTIISVNALRLMCSGGVLIARREA